MKIYVSATRQNYGKTTVALGLLNSIKELYPNTGYIKPVGQQVIIIGSHQVDKDASLMNEVFNIGDSLPDMSPVAIPRGFTRDYILHGDVNKLKQKIIKSYKRASKGKDFMLIEGTGHAGVGSIFDLSNAAVAQVLKAPVIIVTCGGIGRPIDEVMLNKAVFDSYDVNVIGVIINKVKQVKYKDINKYVRLGFKKKGIDVLGVLPFHPMLSSPSIKQLLEDIKGELLCGQEYLDQNVSKIIVGAMPPHTALNYLKGDVLLITPGNREDLILTALVCSSQEIDEHLDVKGIILTGGVLPHKTILSLVKGSNIPTILVKDDTFTTAQKVTNLLVKIRPADIEKITAVKELIKKYVDIDYIIRKLRMSENN